LGPAKGARPKGAVPGGKAIAGKAPPEKAGQGKALDRAGSLLLIGWQGADEKELLSLLEEFRPAGFIYFRRNWPGGLPDLKGAIRGADALAARILGRPLLWAIDQEGGTVQRLDFGPFALPAASELAETARLEGPARVEGIAHRAGLALKDLGFNLNLAPVLDVGTADAYVSSRSFSSDPRFVSKVALAYARGFRRAGLLVCGKHFPGLGSSAVDPHRDLPLVPSQLEGLWERDGLPFRALIADRVPAVMTTHALYRSLDPLLPATLSGRVLSFLRKDYAFRGLALTDDLEMGGIRSIATVGEAAVGAVLAGHDLAIVSRDPGAVRDARDSLLGALRDGRIPPARLREASARLKGALALLGPAA
jgi:beta-N-acetylhexosaminidase